MGLFSHKKRVTPLNAKAVAATATVATAAAGLQRMTKLCVWYEQCDENCYSLRNMLRLKIHSVKLYPEQRDAIILKLNNPLYTSLSFSSRRRSRSNARTAPSPILPVCEYTPASSWWRCCCYYCFCSLLALFFRSSAVFVFVILKFSSFLCCVPLCVHACGIFSLICVCVSLFGFLRVCVCSRSFIMPFSLIKCTLNSAGLASKLLLVLFALVSYHLFVSSWHLPVLREEEDVKSRKKMSNQIQFVVLCLFLKRWKNI